VKGNPSSRRHTQDCITVRTRTYTGYITNRVCTYAGYSATGCVHICIFVDKCSIQVQIDYRAVVQIGYRSSGTG
jgi:hypothetical protein